jgi:hypothetical protein
MTMVLVKSTAVMIRRKGPLERKAGEEGIEIEERGEYVLA